MVRTTIDRLAVKTLDQRFKHELETGFELAPRVSQGILELAKDVYCLDTASAVGTELFRPGRIRQVIAAAGAPHGRPLVQTEMVEVTWTLDAGEEDLEVLEHYGRVALRRVRLLRLVDEASDQGGEPTQEDLAKALGVNARTIRADIAVLSTEGYLVATRGMLRGIGRGQTHKVIIVELYLQRYTYTEIMRRTHHSAAAIKRYLQTFGRIVLLVRKELVPTEMAYVVGISERLVQEYLHLYHRYNLPEHQGRLADLAQMAGRGGSGTVLGSKRGAR
jgi:hypothetical protein